MQASDLVELSGVVTIHGRRFAAWYGWLSESGLREYWSASRSCFERWTLALGRPERTAAGRRETLAVVQEVLSTEILTRVWTAVVCERERREYGGDATPVVQNVLLGHQDVRNRALIWLVQAGEQERVEADMGNRWRQRCERWTDLLLSQLWPDCAVESYAFDAERVRDFTQNGLPPTGSRIAAMAGRLQQLALAAAFSAGKRTRDWANLRTRIAYGIAACFPGECFAPTGPFANLWLRRLTLISDDLQSVVERWCDEEPCPPAEGRRPGRTP